MGGTNYKEAAKMRRTSKNYVFKGNRYTKSINQTKDDVSTSSKSTSATQEKQTGECAINVSSVSTPSTQGASSSSAASKIDFSFYSSVDNNAESGSSDISKTSSNMDTTSMYMMTDIKTFINLLQLVGQCPECSNAITTTVDFSSKKGLAQKVVPSSKDTT